MAGLAFALQAPPCGDDLKPARLVEQGQPTPVFRQAAGGEFKQVVQFGGPDQPPLAPQPVPTAQTGDIPGVAQLRPLLVKLGFQHLHLEWHGQTLVVKPSAATGEHLTGFDPRACDQGLLAVEIQDAIGIGLLNEVVPQVHQGQLAGLALDTAEAWCDPDPDKVRGPLLDARLSSPIVAAGVTGPVADRLQPGQCFVGAAGWRVPRRHTATAASGVVACLRVQGGFADGNVLFGGHRLRRGGDLRRPTQTLAGGAETRGHQSYPRPA